MMTTSDQIPIMDPTSSTIPSLKNEPVFVGSIDPDHDIDGLELAKAAEALGISIDEVWKRIRNGLLIARTIRGRVLVYTDMAEVLATEGLPPPPASDGELTHSELGLTTSRTSRIHQGLESAAMLPMTWHPPTASPNQELALLIDHLSLAKDENREILKLTQDSMNRLTQMTDAIIEMKDAMIASKDEQMESLKQRLAEQSAELLRTLKEKEDLETLTQALQGK